MTACGSNKMCCALAGVLFVLLETVLIAFVDKPLSQFLHIINAEYPALIFSFRAYTDLGKSVWYLWPSFVGLLLCLMLSHWQRIPAHRRVMLRFAWQAFGFFFACVALSGIVTDIIKPILGRARPVLLERQGYYGFDPFTFQAAHNALPSGHATTGFAVAFALTALWPRGRTWFIVFAIVIALSRVMVNAHFLSDVVAGGAVGVLTAAVVQNVFHRYGIFPIDATRPAR